jgi:mono/diheme cytochrome c family protein
MNFRKLLIPCLLATGVAMAQQSQTPPPPATASSGAVPTRTAAAEPSGPSGSSGPAPYTVKDGNKVDDKTLKGWRTWRALACERCHGAEQEGLVGPPLVESLKKLSKEDFHKTIINGRPEKGMPPFGASKMVTDNWEGLYAYLKGRSDGQIKPGHVYPMDTKK